MVVLAISVVNTLPVDELWITYGLGKHVCNLVVHSIAMSLGQDKASVLPMFHAFMGCDTVSFFGGRGKKTAWDVCVVFPEFIQVLRSLKTLPVKIDDACMSVIERFVVLLYDRTSSLTQSMKHAKSSFQRRQGTLTAFLPLKQHLYNIPGEQMGLLELEDFIPGFIEWKYS